MQNLKHEILFSKSPLDWADKLHPDQWKLKEYIGLPNETVIEGSYKTWEYREPKEDYEEPVLDSSLLSWLTVNYYGALILCSRSLFIADIDDGEGVFLDFTKAHEVLDPFYTRIYRTHSGFRVISTFPAQYSADKIGDVISHLETLGTDPKYVAFMSKQMYGRARLSPKPWRWAGESHCQVSLLIHAFGSRDTLSREQERAFFVHDLVTGSNSRKRSSPLV